MAPLYHLLDPVWRRTPFPVRPRLQVERPASLGVTALRMERTWFGNVFMPVYAWVVGDTLVDTGIDCLWPAVRDATPGVRRALVSHHHEDHAGNAAALVAAGVDVRGSELTRRIVARAPPIKLYQHLFWGPMRGAEVQLLGTETEIGPYTARVLSAPGHCDDQVVFHVPSEGWLFSGDAFIHEHIRMFRGDEDFHATLATLERLLTLDFDGLFCGHRPRFTGGKAALAAKRQWLLDLQGRVLALATKGWGASRIVDALELRPRSFASRITFGDASAENLVRAITTGPTPRPEVAACCEASPAGA